METLLSKLIEKLAKVEAFEEAAEIALGTAIEIVRLAITGSAYSKNARVLRAVLHHRPDDGYRRLVAVDVAESGATLPLKLGDAPHMPSAAAWQWVRGYETAAAIDVALGAVSFASDRHGTESTKPVQRDATHLFVVPVRAPGHRIDGMIAVEASCKQASGTPFVWETCREALLLLAAISAPYFTRLSVARIERTMPDELLPVIGQSTAGIVEMLRVFARQDEPILFSGPVGSGKASLARWAHERSTHKSGPFEVVRLASIPEDQQMAELFGARRSTPGAPPKEIPGAVARAEKGTLLLADVERLTPAAQAALARLLEERRYRMSGEDGVERTAQVRFLFGTNTDLTRLVDDGKLRAELFYRMDALPIRVAPLRERPDEIIEWAETMLRRRHVQSGSTSAAIISQEAASKLVAHDWPGNLRQLDNIIRRAYALAQLDHATLADGISLRAEHIERALQYEGKGSPRTLLDYLDMAAEAFVAEAERRTETGIRLDMDLADSFKGLVIEAAKRRWSPEDKDGVKKAFLLLGKEATVKSRNHWATYEREFEKVQELKRVLAAAQNGNGNGNGNHNHGHMARPTAVHGHHPVASHTNGNGHAHHPAANGNHGISGTNGSLRATDGV
ncbi:MAG: sigma 54-interacting transcriptional regulator [Polyangiaceae bacterium]